jgi:hypothetical protein
MRHLLPVIASINGLKGTLANSNQRNSKGFEPTVELDKPIGPFSKFKLDWIFVKSYWKESREKNGSYKFAPYFGWTLKRFNHSVTDFLSDHDPMIVDLPVQDPPKPQ